MTRINQLLKKVKGKVINATATVIAAKPIIKSKMVQRQATKDVNTIKYARAFDNSTSDRAVMARTAAEIVKERLMKKIK